MAIWPGAQGGHAAPARDDPDADPAGRPRGSSFTPSSRRSGQQNRIRGGWRARLTVLGLAVGLAGLAASAAGVVVQALPRTFTAGQQRQITAWEVGARWRTWPAGRIFPATVRYWLPGESLASTRGLGLIAQRTGIAPQAPCRTASTDPAVAAALTAHGCLAVLRATYQDLTGSMAVTVGIAVFPDPAAESAAARALPRGVLPGGKGFTVGVRPVAFPGTATAQFGAAQRQLSWASERGPYLVMAAAGYADGRPRLPMPEPANYSYALAEMRSLAVGVAGAVGSALGGAPPVPRCPGTPGC